MIAFKGEWYVKYSYYIVVILIVILGITTLALQNYEGEQWKKSKSLISLGLSIVATIIFMMTMQPYAAFFTFIFLLIKGVMLMKRA